MKYIDLSHTFVDNMPVFPGDPPVSLKQITTVDQHGYTDHQLTTVMHVGTHMDAPLHMISGGMYMDELPLELCSGSGVLLDVRGKQKIGIEELPSATIPKGSAVLLFTGKSDQYKTDAYNSDYPTITEEFANAIVDAGVYMLGMDMINPDVTETYPIHKILLKKPVLIIENLTNLSALVGVPAFEVFSFPVKLHAEAAPVRTVARIP